MHVRQPQDLSGVLCHVWWEDCPIPDHPDVSKEKFESLCKKLQQNLSSTNSQYNNIHLIGFLYRHFVTSSRSIKAAPTRGRKECMHSNIVMYLGVFINHLFVMNTIITFKGERSSRSLFLPNLRNLIVMVTSSAYRVN